MNLAFDPGYGAIKLYGPRGALVLPSAVATHTGETIRRMAGVRVRRPPLLVETSDGRFYVGANAHDWGRPVENLDLERLTGAPELLALFLGALSRYCVPTEPLQIIVGLPIAAMTGEAATAVQQGVKRWLRGEHDWRAAGKAHNVTIEKVMITSQPVGAMFDYLLSESGQMPPDRRETFKGELGIIGIGMNTLDLLVVRSGSPVQRFTAGDNLGVRRLLELCSRRGLYSLAELDGQLREGKLDYQGHLAIWQSEVLGFVERHWGRGSQRFGVIIVAGGGGKLLQHALLRRFKGRGYLPDDPVVSTARGLYKFLQRKD